MKPRLHKVPLHIKPHYIELHSGILNPGILDPDLQRLFQMGKMLYTDTAYVNYNKYIKEFRTLRPEIYIMDRDFYSAEQPGEYCRNENRTIFRQLYYTGHSGSGRHASPYRDK